MKQNVGTADRVVRAVLGLAIGAAGLYYQNWFGLVGLVFLGTALTGLVPGLPAVRVVDLQAAITRELA